MGIPPSSSSSSTSSDDQKQKIVMGYPSMIDRYNSPQHTYPPQPPPFRPQGYATSSSSSSSSYQFPQPPPYASSSSPSHHYPQPYDPTYLSSASRKPYNPQPNYNNDFYYPRQHYKPLVPDPNNHSSFGRVMLILMIVLVASMCMMTLVMWFLFGTYIPEFEVSSLKVSNFTVSNTTLTGVWDIGISVSNTNKELAIRFDHVISSVFYKEAMLGISDLHPFQVPQLQRSDVNITMAVEQAENEDKVQSWVLPTLAQDHSNGMVVFSLRFALNANFTTPNMVYRQENMKVMCENLQVMFSLTGEGALSPGLVNTCLIRINDGLKD